MILLMKDNILVEQFRLLRSFLQLIVADDLVDMKGVLANLAQDIFVEDIAEDEVILVHNLRDLCDRTHEEARIVDTIEDDRFKDEGFLFVNLAQREELPRTTHVLFLDLMQFVDVL